MNRRRFLAGSLAGAAVLGAAAVPTDQPAARARRARLKLGNQHRSDDASLRIMAALGVRNICSALPSRNFDDAWSVAGLSQLRERVERFGIQLDMVPLPLSSSFITRSENPNIMRGKSPERDREIDHIGQMIRNAAKAGIPAGAALAIAPSSIASRSTMIRRRRMRR